MMSFVQFSVFDLTIGVADLLGSGDQTQRRAVAFGQRVSSMIGHLYLLVSLYGQKVLVWTPYSYTHHSQRYHQSRPPQRKQEENLLRCISADDRGSDTTPIALHGAKICKNTHAIFNDSAKPLDQHKYRWK